MFLLIFSAITDSPISLRFLHNLENNTITFNCTSIFVSLSWKEIDRSSFVLLNWTEKASFATFRMVSSKLRFIYTPNISSCLEYSGMTIINSYFSVQFYPSKDRGAKHHHQITMRHY